MEQTMLTTFIRNARLRQWLARPDLPFAVKMCSRLFRSYFGGSSPYLLDVEDAAADEVTNMEDPNDDEEECGSQIAKVRPDLAFY